MDFPDLHPVPFAIRGPIAPVDVQGLCARACALLDCGSPKVLACDVRRLEPDAVTIDALARLALLARRHRSRIHFLGGAPELLELASFMGLADVLAGERYESI